MKNLQKRAKELHNLIKYKHARDRSTTAVLSTDHNRSIVGSSEMRLRREQRQALDKDEIEATGKGHAEETVMNKADEWGMKGKEIGVSRPVCSDCEKLIKSKNIETKAIFSGKKSIKRNKNE